MRSSVDALPGKLTCACLLLSAAVAARAGQPTILGIVPDSGPEAGGTTVTITLDGFYVTQAVYFGGTPAPSFWVIDATSIGVTSPPRGMEPEYVSVTVLTTDGMSLNAVTFRYIPPPPVVTSVDPDVIAEQFAVPLDFSVWGANFSLSGLVCIRPDGGSTWTPMFTMWLAPTALDFIAMSLSPGLYDVMVDNGGGETGELLGAFTVLPRPRIDSVTPDFGNVAGGTLVVITGEHFDPSYGCSASIGYVSWLPLTDQVVSADGTWIRGRVPPYALTIPEGRIAGIASATATDQTFTVEAADGVGSATRDFTIRVVELAVSPDPLPAGVVGTAYSEQLMTSGETPPCSWSAVGLPAGLALSPDGLLSGTPTDSSGSPYAVTVTVTDSGAPARSQDWTYAMEILPSGLHQRSGTWDAGAARYVLPVAVEGSPYECALEAVGGAPPYGFAGAALPPWLSLDPGAGYLAGMVPAGASSASPYDFTVTVSDSSGPPLTAARDFRLNVVGGASPLTIVTESLPPAITGHAYEVQIETAGGVPANVSCALTAGGMPEGLHLNAELEPVNVEAIVAGTDVDVSSWGFTYVGGPDVLDVTPSQGVYGGGDPVTIVGADFAPDSRVFFGPDEALSVVVNGPGTTITCITPAHFGEELVDVRVVAPDGSVGEAPGGFLFFRAPAVLAGIKAGSDEWDYFPGGKEITLEGDEFQEGATVVTFDGIEAEVTSWTSATEITVRVPPAPAPMEGYVDISAQNALGGGTVSGVFHYLDAPPSAILTSPQAGTLSGAVSLQADASDDRAITRVVMQYSTADPVTGPWTDVAPEDTVWPYSVAWDTATVADGTCHLRAVAYDDHSPSAVNGGGNQSTPSASVTVTVDNSTSPSPADNPPVVTITWPTIAEPAWGTSAPLSADVTDDLNAVAEARFFVGGVEVGVDADGADGWSVAWDSTAVADGQYALVARATDAGGNSATDGAYFAVANADTDSDGLPDGREIALGTLPGNPDTDGDTLSDGDEVVTHGTDPLKGDTDGDGLLDDEELEDHGTDPLLEDTDGDGLTDGLEVAKGEDPLVPLAGDDGACRPGAGGAPLAWFLPLAAACLALRRRRAPARE